MQIKTQKNTRITPLRLLRDGVILALGIMLAALSSDGIYYDSNQTLVLVLAVLIAFNLFLKPLLIIFALPFVVFTFGLGIWLINALLLYLASEFINGFTVATFPTALWGAFVISLTNILINLFLNPNLKVQFNASAQRKQNPKSKDSKDDVIDV